jgi:hypothetical protein
LAAAAVEKRVEKEVLILANIDTPPKVERTPMIPDSIGKMRGVSK